MRALTPVARAVRLVGRSRRLTWAEAAWAAYITAEQGLEIALVVFAYGHGGIAAAGLLAAARSGASAVTAPFTAGLGDRFDRRLVLVGAALLTSAVVACMSLAVAMADGPWPVYVLALVAAVVIPVYRPVQAALLPRLAETPAQLTAANVIVSMLEGVGNLAGPALAGGLIVWAGPPPHSPRWPRCRSPPGWRSAACRAPRPRRSLPERHGSGGCWPVSRPSLPTATCAC